MVPTYAQLIIIVILIVPGFAAIKIYQKLMPFKEKNVFDLSVSSIILTLFIHGIYTTLFIYKYNDKVNNIFNDLKYNSTISNTSAKWILIYFLALIAVIILIGWFLALVKNSGFFYKHAKRWGFQTSNFDNLWYELLYIYNINGKVPYIIVEFEDIAYAGAVDRSSFRFGNDEQKEITLVNPRMKKVSDEKFHKLNVEVVYLDLKDIKAIKFFNGEVLVNSNI
jgi:Family of unknown function (DUF6338)